MSEKRSIATIRSATFISALLLTTTFTVPAFAQIETVVVTAERKAEDIQTVPIAVSAFSGADLQSKQITGFANLQFNVPNVTFTHGNFGPSNFQIRGIGSAAVSTSGDAGVSVETNDVYLASPPLTSGIYYDVESIEVLRGPQGTLHGRNATGGSIDLHTAKPDLDNFLASAEATYGNYNDTEGRVMVNLPLIDGKLAVRGAFFIESRDGTYKNIATNGRIDSRDDYSGRVSVRWQPSDATTFDLMVQHGQEYDSRVRAVVQGCHRDPSGVLGCLPDKNAFDPINLNGTAFVTLSSDISSLRGTPFQLADITAANGATVGNSASSGATVPGDFRSVNMDFTPQSYGWDDFASLTLNQKIASWLSMTALVGYDVNSGVGRQGYFGTQGDPYSSHPATATQSFLLGLFGCPAQPSRVAAAQEYLICAPGAFGGRPISGNHFYAGHLGTLPISGVGNDGLAGDNIFSYANHDQAYDQIDGRSTEWTGEVRFSSNLDGPVNFQVGAFHLHVWNDAHYFVNFTAADYLAVVGGAEAVGDGILLAPTQFDSDNKSYTLNSSAVFGEVYWDITDELKLTGGLRYSEDTKAFESRNNLLDSIAIIGSGTAGVNHFLDLACGGVQDCSYTRSHGTFDALTGHAVLRWSPHLDWTDASMFYASYSRGYRSGGFNPPSQTGAFPPTFKPEKVDAYELGTKDTFLDAQLQANLTAWYYNYIGYQVSKIVDRTSVNVNINSRLWGLEGEFFYAPSDDLQFNANVGYNGSELAHGVSDFDTLNPSQDMPNDTVVKDVQGANCVIQGPTAATSATPGFGTILAEGPVSSIAGVAAHLAYLNSQSFPAASALGLTCAQLISTPATFLPVGYTAIPAEVISLAGKKMPNTPAFSFNIGAQYTFHLPDAYTVVPRIDYYWKGSMYTRIFNAPRDYIGAWDEINAQVQLNSGDGVWYVRGWVKNLADKDNITGNYYTNDGSGLFANLFLEEPRTYGLTLGAKF